jgi:hypothetical protein
MNDELAGLTAADSESISDIRGLVHPHVARYRCYALCITYVVIELLDHLMDGHKSLKAMSPFTNLVTEKAVSIRD